MNYIWSDECSIEKGRTGTAKWVFKHESEDSNMVALADGTNYISKSMAIFIYKVVLKL